MRLWRPQRENEKENNKQEGAGGNSRLINDPDETSTDNARSRSKEVSCSVMVVVPRRIDGRGEVAERREARMLCTRELLGRHGWSPTGVEVPRAAR